jgi:hypothetical protein
MLLLFEDAQRMFRSTPRPRIDLDQRWWRLAGRHDRNVLILRSRDNRVPRPVRIAGRGEFDPGQSSVRLTRAAQK